MQLFLVLKMQLTVSLSIVLLMLLTLEVGGDNTDPYSDGSNVNGNSPLCRVVRDTRKSVLTSFENKYNASNSSCNIANHCNNVTCTAIFPRSSVNAGLGLNLCKEDPELSYWVNIPGQWEQPWNYTFSARPDGLAERKEISGGSNETKPTRWFIKNKLSITHGHDRISKSIKYLSVLSILQICQSVSVSEETCANTTLLNFTRLTLSQICEFPVLDVSDIGEDQGYHNHEIALLRSKPSDLGGSYYASSTRSSRNANANPWDPEQLRRVAAERAAKLEAGKPVHSAPGDPCNIEDIFGCGPGATCAVTTDDGSGLCSCIRGYAFNTTSTICVKQAPSPSPSSDNSSIAKNGTSSASAVGVIISLIIIVAIATGIYFGIRTNYFSHLRHRFPVFRCWPFRRSPTWEDNVTMVNPLGPPDDDDPLLL